MVDFRNARSVDFEIRLLGSFSNGRIELEWLPGVVEIENGSASYSRGLVSSCRFIGLVD